MVLQAAVSTFRSCESSRAGVAISQSWKLRAGKPAKVVRSSVLGSVHFGGDPSKNSVFDQSQFLSRVYLPCGMGKPAGVGKDASDCVQDSSILLRSWGVSAGISGRQKASRADKIPSRKLCCGHLKKETWRLWFKLSSFGALSYRMTNVDAEFPSPSGCHQQERDASPTLRSCL